MKFLDSPIETSNDPFCYPRNEKAKLANAVCIKIKGDILIEDDLNICLVKLNLIKIFHSVIIAIDETYLELIPNMGFMLWYLMYARVAAWYSGVMVCGSLFGNSWNNKAEFMRVRNRIIIKPWPLQARNRLGTHHLGNRTNRAGKENGSSDQWTLPLLSHPEGEFWLLSQSRTITWHTKVGHRTLRWWRINYFHHFEGLSWR